jgi:hypothetical protein
VFSGPLGRQIAVREKSPKNAKNRQRFGLTPTCWGRTFPFPQQGPRRQQGELADRLRSESRHRNAAEKLLPGLEEFRLGRTSCKAERLNGTRRGLGSDGIGAVFGPEGRRETGSSLGRRRATSRAAPKGKARRGRGCRKVASVSEKVLRYQNRDAAEASVSAANTVRQAAPNGAAPARVSARVGGRRDHTRTGEFRLDRAGRGGRKGTSADRSERLERVAMAGRGTTPRGRRFGEAPSGFSFS